MLDARGEHERGAGVSAAGDWIRLRSVNERVRLVLALRAELGPRVVDAIEDENVGLDITRHAEIYARAADAVVRAADRIRSELAA